MWWWCRSTLRVFCDQSLLESEKQDNGICFAHRQIYLGNHQFGRVQLLHWYPVSASSVWELMRERASDGSISGFHNILDSQKPSTSSHIGSNVLELIDSRENSAVNTNREQMTKLSNVQLPRTSSGSFAKLPKLFQNKKDQVSNSLIDRLSHRLWWVIACHRLMITASLPLINL